VREEEKDVSRLPDIVVRLILVLATLFIISCIFPANGIWLSSRYTLTFPTVREVLELNDVSSEAITIDCGDFTREPKHGAKSVLPLSCTIDDVRALPLQPIEYPQGRKDALQSIMAELAMLRANNRGFVRILHYGDSQLEADRMTLYLRKQLQKEFGGGGVGYVALNPQIPVNPTVKISMSNDWVCSTPAVHYKQASPLRVGHLLSSVKLPSKQDKNSWIKVERRALTAYPALRFSNMKLLLSCRYAPIFLTVKTATKTLYAGTIQPDKDIRQLVVNMQSSREGVTLSFSGKGCPEIYGLAMDYGRGVAIDNIPLRSSSGVDFVKADAALLQQSFECVGAKFMILQFGTNMVPKIMSSYNYYEEQLYEQLMLLKRLAPAVDVLVVGLSDMARRSKGLLTSYPNIEKIRDAQRNAAFRAGCAFWDTYKAMGGKNSIVSWVYAQPSLASKDFCHFSGVGATLVAELMYRSFDRELKLYLLDHGANRPTPVAEK
jgi:hypothetical protein